MEASFFTEKNSVYFIEDAQAYETELETFQPDKLIQVLEQRILTNRAEMARLKYSLLAGQDTDIISRLGTLETETSKLVDRIETVHRVIALYDKERQLAEHKERIHTLVDEYTDTDNTPAKLKKIEELKSMQDKYRKKEQELTQHINIVNLMILEIARQSPQKQEITMDEYKSKRASSKHVQASVAKPRPVPRKRITKKASTEPTEAPAPAPVSPVIEEPPKKIKLKRAIAPKAEAVPAKKIKLKLRTIVHAPKSSMFKMDGYPDVAFYKTPSIDIPERMKDEADQLIDYMILARHIENQIQKEDPGYSVSFSTINEDMQRVKDLDESVKSRMKTYIAELQSTYGAESAELYDIYDTL
jgi:hypothetical protein